MSGVDVVDISEASVTRQAIQTISGVPTTTHLSIPWPTSSAIQPSSALDKRQRPSTVSPLPLAPVSRSRQLRLTRKLSRALSLPHPGDYHIIPIKHISSFDIISLDPNAAKQTISTVQPPIAAVDIKKLRDREEAKIRQLRDQEANKGKGVSREAQQIYDALRRMLPTRWHGQEIVVSDSVIISPPYTVNDCKAPKGKDQALDRIRMILDGERRKIAQRAAQGGTPPPGAPRKGEDTKGQPQEEHAESMSCVVQIPTTEITKRVNRQHLYKLLYRSLSHLPSRFMSMKTYNHFPIEVSSIVICCHNVAIKMHNNFAKMVISRERPFLKAISMVRLIDGIQLCILIVPNAFTRQREKEVDP
ncbi:hypothetical protein KCU70_g301, partial [Aureobasidium melanogenum]